MPLVLLLSGIGTFVLIGIAGLSVIERYLIVAALALLLFAAVALGGFTMLRRAAATPCGDVAALLVAGRRRLHRHPRRRHEASPTSCSSAATPTAALVHVLQRPGGQGRAALRPADRAERQARPRLALDPRPAARPCWRAPTPTCRRARSRAASRSTSTTRFAIFRHAFDQPRRPDVDPDPAAGLAPRRDQRDVAAYAALLRSAAAWPRLAVVAVVARGARAAPVGLPPGPALRLQRR